jgi:hypothetical protein
VRTQGDDDMKIRDKMIERVTPFLEPGEQVEQVFAAQTKSPYLALITYWLLVVGNPYRVVAATDRRVVVCRLRRFSGTAVTGIVSEAPRGTRIGPATGIWYKTQALGERLYIHKRFHKDVAAADAADAANVA